MKALLLAWATTSRMFRNHARIWLPFAAIILLEVAFLGVLWSAAHPPFRAVLAPPIAYFFGERVLHYPLHLFFLYAMMNRIHGLAWILAGAYLSGLACVMVRQVHEGKTPCLREALVSRQVRYGRVTLLWLLSWLLVRFALRIHWGAAAALQVLLVYAVPAAVFYAGPGWRAFFRGVGESLRYPLSTLVTVLGPVLGLLALAQLLHPVRVAGMMSDAATPEAVLWFLPARLLLWIGVEAILTVAVAHLWWFHRAAEERRRGARNVGRGESWSLQHAACGLLVALALGLTGCSADYQGQRLYWKASQKVLAMKQMEPDQRSEAQYAEAIEKFRRVVKAAPHTPWAARAMLEVGSLYGAQGKFDAAREAYGWLLANRPHTDFALRARLAVAKTYEFGNRWEGAIQTYQEIAEYHPWSRSGFGSLLTIAEIHKKLGHEEQARRAYERAVRECQKRVAEAPTDSLAARARGYLALVYQRLGRWEEALQMFQELAETPRGVNRPLVLLKIGTIYEKRLDDSGKAGAVYARLLEEFPRHPLAKVAQAHLDRLPSAGPAQETGGP